MVLCQSLAAQERIKLNRFTPGEVWPDTAGKPIQAHGGAVIVRGKRYFWYGEDRTVRNRTNVSCYSSTDLYNWKQESVVFAHDALPEDIRTTTFIERPKVVFNAKTGKYVLWMHLEQRGYHFARAGIAVGDQPDGPFTFLHHMRPVQYDFGYPDNDPDRQNEFGGTYRDMNLFVDDDGKAYALYASEGNWTLYIVRLNDEYTGPETPVKYKIVKEHFFLGAPHGFETIEYRGQEKGDRHNGLCTTFALSEMHCVASALRHAGNEDIYRRNTQGDDCQDENNQGCPK